MLLVFMNPAALDRWSKKAKLGQEIFAITTPLHTYIGQRVK